MRFFVRSLPVLATCALLAACQNGGQKSSGSPYVSNYGNDGGYNPYPDQPGTMQSGGGGGYSPAPAAPATPTYSTPPVQSDPYAFSPGSSGSSSSGSSSSTVSSTPRKTPAKTTASSSKGKSKSKSTAKKSSGSYKVASGDTLYGIALKRGTTVAKIKAANKLTSDLIRPGQALKIP